MATDTGKEDFVTIVPVGESRPPVSDPATFVTVLTVGAIPGAEVVVRRPRGARLGLGLKFEGGSAATEKVRRLLVQSCTDDSPAANAVAPWGKLIPGDEILAIENVPVSELTRIDCVRRLKDSDEHLTLIVRHFHIEDVNEKDSDVTDSSVNCKQTDTGRPNLPPPVPPRKLGKKNSFKDKNFGEINIQKPNEKDSKISMQQVAVTNNFNNKLSRKSSFDSHIHRQNKDGISCLRKGSPEEVRRLARRLSDGKSMPPEAEKYMNILSNEWERCVAMADAESDDTGSSISTVVDRLGSITSSVENSIPSTPIMQQKTFDIQKVLNCIENIDSNILEDMTTSIYLENSINFKNEVKSCEKSMYCNGNPFKQTDIQEAQEAIHNNDVVPKSKQLPFNDKNNNTTSAHNITLITLDLNKNGDSDKLPAINKDLYPEKPTPKPRSVKTDRVVDKENKVEPIIEVTEGSAVDQNLLTPTKKDCIETWLLRSEVELGVKKGDNVVEDRPLPEALPRLIDFVPKPQFKECVAETSQTPVISRPTSAPPPPPEPREDGSGASLDTIGELDESADSSLTEKSVVPENKDKDRKATFCSSFWEERVNKSDVEDKSLSNDESPLPTCPRQPPDGVETPSDMIEKVSDASAIRLPPRLPSGWPTTRTRLSYSRAQDARSEASVKDKIAMFSNDRATSSDRVDKCGTLPSRTNMHIAKVSYMDGYTDIKSLDRRLTRSQDNLDDVPRPYQRQSERPEVLGALEITNKICNGSSVSRNSLDTTLRDNKPLFYGSTNTLPLSTRSTYNPPVSHSRTSSDDSSKGSQKLEYLIEQRKKSTSKLRALMIPETQSPIIDLPEIKVENRLATSFISDRNKVHVQNNFENKNTGKVLDFKDTWKSKTLQSNVPKYSPAFKRKSLQLYSSVPFSKDTTPEPKLNNITKYPYLHRNDTKQSVPLKPPRQSLDKIIQSVESKGINTNTGSHYKEYKTINNIRDYNNMEVKICTITDIIDSDNDSAMSSTQSSYRSSASSPLHTLDSIESDSSHLSPRISHFTTYTATKTDNPVKMLTSKITDDYEKRNICRSVSSDTNISLSSSAGSAATSGSQASCSSLESSVADTDKKRTSIVYDIDTINRKNILASAKCRSGRDAKVKSPVLDTKFSHESCEASKNSQQNVPDRLSTLTSVSAISNKGETRRRNKVVAASDSDTDNEINIRQRKAELKNTRLKRNSSTNSKNKQNDICVDAPKASEDVPQVISERIIKQIKKAGLDNYPSTNKPVLQSKLLEINVKSECKRTDKNMKVEDTEFTDNNSSDSLLNDKNKHRNENGISNVKKKPENGDVSVQNTEAYTICLKKGTANGVGLILAGGIDCEAKHVTVHRVLADSIAQRAGLKRGVRVRSINGCAMAGLTHAQSVAVLKEQRSEVIIEIENEDSKPDDGASCGSSSESKARLKADAVIAKVASVNEGNGSGDLVTVVLDKASKAGGTGLGFSLEGGRDSQDGGRPLTIKKLFQGGVAEQSGCVRVGAELLSAGGQRLEGHTRFKAWDFLKGLPIGPVTLVLRNPTSGGSKKD